MKPLLYFKLLAAGLLPLLTGCDSFVDVDMPASQLTSEAVFQTTATANAAMAHIYASVRDNGPLSGSPTGIACLMGGYADELDYYGLAGNSAAFFFSNTVLPTDLQVNSYWNESYAQIYATNAVIESTGSLSPIPQQEKDRLQGEALFLRAWLHFYLAGLYGDIPYVTTTDHAVNSAVSRQPIATVYAKAIEDLEQALLLLPETDLTFSRSKPNRWTAYALLARTYLYAGDYAAASNAASALLNNAALFSLNPDLGQVFLNTSPETIWQLQPEAGNGNSLEALTFIFVTAPPPNVALSQGLTDAFEPGDARRTEWVKAVPGENQTWYHAYKYRQQGPGSSSTENSILLRTAELYLIRAEARARQGELSAAKDDLNAIRLRAGLPVTTAASQPELLDAILQERRVELFTEAGHRFFDLKRYGAADAVLGPVKPNWQSTDVLLPIPENELVRNPNLGSQNPGY
ncbi:RagB/SusD family nutrient uptake outer membrane protein [Flavobacterium qiangtangense]|uniref:RagB/SusD family nutrient uptake outer membrane protein n=1 Tax=Flavobacterium qiangtangense TaxID=1442595 RepID=A0ABW1PJH3_9FLAO